MSSRGSQPHETQQLFATPSPTSADRNRRVARAESFFAYLAQSTHPGDESIRANLELMFAQLPAAARAELLPRLQNRNDARVKDAVTELVVHQCLTELRRTDIEVSPPTVGGRRGDYRLADLPLHLEVARVGESASLLGEQRRRHQIVEALNEVSYGRFSLSVTLHSGTSAPSVKSTRRAILDWLAALDADTERVRLETDPLYQPPTRPFAFDDWTAVVVARPLRADAPPEEAIGQLIAPRPPGQRPGERDPEPVTVETIRAKIKDKRSQHRGLQEPLLLVLDLSAGMVSDREVADALYGARPRVGWNDPVDQGALWPVEARSGHSGTAGAGTNVVGVLVLDHLHLTSLATATATMWTPPGLASPLEGPWRTARWQAPPPTDPLGPDIVIDPHPGPQASVLKL